jgi:transposase
MEKIGNLEETSPERRRGDLGRRHAPRTARGGGSGSTGQAPGQGFGIVGRVGIEGTSSYGAGLVRYLHSAEIPVVEVERPKCRHLRRKGKSDSIDTEAAARAVLAGEAAGEPKSGETAKWG